MGLCRSRLQHFPRQCCDVEHHGWPGPARFFTQCRKDGLTDAVYGVVLQIRNRPAAVQAWSQGGEQQRLHSVIQVDQRAAVAEIGEGRQSARQGLFQHFCHETAPGEDIDRGQSQDGGGDRGFGQQLFRAALGLRVEGGGTIQDPGAAGEDDALHPGAPRDP